MLYKVVLIFKPVDETLVCGHSKVGFWWQFYSILSFLKRSVHPAVDSHCFVYPTSGYQPHQNMPSYWSPKLPNRGPGFRAAAVSDI